MRLYVCVVVVGGGLYAFSKREGNIIVHNLECGGVVTFGVALLCPAAESHGGAFQRASLLSPAAGSCLRSVACISRTHSVHLVRQVQVSTLREFRRGEKRRATHIPLQISQSRGIAETFGKWIAVDLQLCNLRML